MEYMKLLDEKIEQQKILASKELEQSKRHMDDDKNCPSCGREMAAVKGPRDLALQACIGCRVALPGRM